MVDLKLDRVNHDLSIENYDIQLVSGVDQIRQKIESKLQFFYGEWFLDNTKGVKLYETVFVKNPDLTLVASLFKSAILEISGTKDILEYNQVLNSALRTLTIDFKVSTVYGTVDGTVTL